MIVVSHDASKSTQLHLPWTTAKESKKLRNKVRKLHDRHEEMADIVRFRRLHLHNTGRIFDGLEKLTGHFHREPCNIFVLLT